MSLDKELVDRLLVDYEKPEDIIGENGLLRQLTKAIVERALSAELSTHLGYEKHAAAGRRSGVPRNRLSVSWRSLEWLQGHRADLVSSQDITAGTATGADSGTR